MTTTLVLDPSTSRTVITESGGATLVQESTTGESVTQERVATTVTETAQTQTLITEPGTRGPAGPPGEDAPPSFESFAKNLRAYPSTLAYVDDDLAVVTYTTPDGTVAKTLGYVSGRLETLTLSGAIPSGIDTTKTLVYAGDSLASVSYS